MLLFPQLGRHNAPAPRPASCPGQVRCPAHQHQCRRQGSDQTAPVSHQNGKWVAQDGVAKIHKARIADIWFYGFGLARRLPQARSAGLYLSTLANSNFVVALEQRRNAGNKVLVLEFFALLFCENWSIQLHSQFFLISWRCCGFNYAQNSLGCGLARGLWGSNAQQPTSGLPAPLVAAARTAVLTNPEVQARWNGFKASESDRQYARAGFFPKIDFVGTIGRRNLTTPTASYGSFNFNAAELTLDQMLYDGMYTANESKRLGLAKLTRYYELREIAENITLEAMRAYIDVLRYRELVDAATQNYIEHKRSAQLVQERAKSGVGKGVDVEQANGRLALAEFNLVVELANLHDVSARYLRVVGEKPPLTLPCLARAFCAGSDAPQCSGADG
jgi:hypothetical protein